MKAVLKRPALDHNNVADDSPTAAVVYGPLEFEPYREGSNDFVESYSGFSTELHLNKRTGHWRFEPMPPDHILDQYYNGTFTRSIEDPTPENEFRPDLLDAVRGVYNYLIAVNLIRNGETFTYHDVGCGFGAGVWAFQQLGIKATGNEANRDWVERANAYCDGALSHEPLAKTLARLGYKIDVFHSAHVLEHLADPLAILELMAAHMSDRGVAYLTVPNGHSQRIMLRGRRGDGGLDYLFPMHLNYFTPRSMCEFVRAAGLEPVQIETRPLDELPEQANDPDWRTKTLRTLLGGELFILAVKRGNNSILRNPDLDALVDSAYYNFMEHKQR